MKGKGNNYRIRQFRIFIDMPNLQQMFMFIIVRDVINNIIFNKRKINRINQ